jgi:hypothetical protein
MQLISNRSCCELKPQLKDSPRGSNLVIKGNLIPFFILKLGWLRWHAKTTGVCRLVLILIECGWINKYFLQHVQASIF